MSLSSNFKKLVPTLNRILIKKLEPQTKTKGSIILSTKEVTPNVGEVINVGSGIYDDHGKKIPISIDIGARVLLPEFGGSKIELNDGEYYLYKDTEILGILQEPVE